LAAGIRSVLSRETNLHVAAIAPKCEAALIEEIRLLQPDVVVLDETTHIVRLAKLLGLLEDYPDLRVVVLRTTDNRVRVYDKQEVSVAQIADLVEVIRHGSTPSCSGEGATHSRSRGPNE